MGNEVHHVKSYLVLYDEDTWGVTPGAPDLVHLPAENYGVRLRPERRNGNQFGGIRQRKHGRKTRGMPSGQLVTHLFGWETDPPDETLAKYMLDWALLGHESIDLPSKGAIWAEGPDVSNKRHTGLRVNSATLSGSDDSGEITLTLDLMGQDEEGQSVVGSAPSLPNNRHKMIDFEFPDIEIEVGGTPIGIRDFQLQLQNNLSVIYNNSRRPQIVSAGVRATSFQFGLIKDSDAYDAFRRLTATEEEKEIVLTLRGLHMGTGGGGTDWTVATITMPRCQYVDHEDNRSREELALMPLQWDVLKPDTSANELSIAYTEEAAIATTTTTTTMA